jgi:phosphate transport system substrate-binding protein
MPRTLAFALMLILLGAAGCGGGGGGGDSTQKSGGSLTGAGSSLVAPLVSAWAVDYEKRTGVHVGYNPVGSGAGIQAITNREVDFGASDAPLTPDQARAAHGVLQIPWALAATLVSYNLKDAPNRLKLSGPIVADIFLGRITKWNDPAIVKLNAGVTLPETDITPVFRSDGSGDTYAFTDYLSKVSPEWKAKVGTSTQVNFPAGVGARGNSGVAGTIKQTDGGIGYLAIAYVFETKLDYALLQNAAGKFPVPGIASIAAAAKTVTSLAADNAVSITNPPASAPDAYPLSTFTYALVPEQSPRASLLKPFLTYAIGDGQRFGKQYRFAPLPNVVLTAGHDAIAKIHP